MKFSGFFFSAEDQHSSQDRYRFLLQAAKYLDTHDYHAIWTPERHFQEFGGAFPNPSVLSAALSQVTQQLQLRAGCTVLPHHHPVRAAEEWALVDQLSGGRVGVGVASGWHKRDFIFFPDNHEKRKTVALEGIDTLRKLWQGDEVTVPGVDGEPTQIRLYPKPLQTAIPVWLVCSTDPNVWITAGKKGLNILSLLDNWESLERNIANYRRAREEAGYDPELGWVTTAVHTFVGDNDTEVKKLVERPMKQYLSSFVKATNDNNGLNGDTKKRVSEEERELLLDAVFKDMFEKRALFGSVEKCTKIVRRLTALGTNEIACFIDFGLDFSTVMQALPKLDQLKQEFASPTMKVVSSSVEPTHNCRVPSDHIVNYYKNFV